MLLCYTNNSGMSCASQVLIVWGVAHAPNKRYIDKLGIEGVRCWHQNASNMQGNLAADGKVNLFVYLLE